MRIGTALFLCRRVVRERVRRISQLRATVIALGSVSHQFLRLRLRRQARGNTNPINIVRTLVPGLHDILRTQPSHLALHPNLHLHLPVAVVARLNVALRFFRIQLRKCFRICRTHRPQRNKRSQLVTVEVLVYRSCQTTFS